MTTNVNFCPKCGTKAAEGGLFCSACGNAFAPFDSLSPRQANDTAHSMPPVPPRAGLVTAHGQGVPPTVNLVLPMGLVASAVTFLGSLTAGLAFFAPWISTFLGDISAADLASLGKRAFDGPPSAELLYAVPASSAATALLSFFRGYASRFLGILLGFGLLGVGAWVATEAESGFGWGLFLFAFGSMLVVIGNLLGLRDLGRHRQVAFREGARTGSSALPRSSIAVLLSEIGAAFATAWRSFSAKRGKSVNIKDLPLLFQEARTTLTPVWESFLARRDNNR